MKKGIDEGATILDEQSGQEILVGIRDRIKKIRDAWANPQYGTNVEDETRFLLDEFEQLDNSLSAGSHLPTDWR